MDDSNNDYNEIKSSLAEAYITMLQEQGFWKLSDDEYFDLVNAFDNHDWGTIRKYEDKMQSYTQSEDWKKMFLQKLFGKPHKVVYRSEQGTFKINKPMIEWMRENGTSELKTFIEDAIEEGKKDNVENIYDYVERRLLEDYEVCGMERHNEELVASVEALGVGLTGLSVCRIMGNYYRIDDDGIVERVETPDLLSYTEIL